MSRRFTKAIIVGASSGMGAAMARRLAADGCRVALVARRAEELAALAGELNAAGGGGQLAWAYPHDVTCYDEAPELFQRICRDLEGLDLFIYAAGAMPRLVDNEYTFEKDRLIMETNVLGAVAWCNEAAQRFAADGAGTLVGISSVAGDRGRVGQPVYCASKACLDTYLEALRNRINRTGAKVVTIKPGPVDTPMTAGLKMPLMISADEAAKQILAAAERGVRLAYVPWQWRFIMGIISRIPSALFQKMNI